MRYLKYIIIAILIFVAFQSKGQTIQVNQKDSTVFKPSTFPIATVQIIGKQRITDSLILTHLPIGNGNDSILSITSSGIVGKVLNNGGGIVIGQTTYQFQDSTNTPPVSFPVGIDSVYYMVGGNGNGIFTGHNYQIALYISGVFNTFITPVVNDWGFVLTGTAQNTWHQYDGSTWPRRNAPSWSTAGNVGGGILGSTNNTNVFLQRNNQNRIILGAAANAVRFPTMTGAAAGLMGLSTTGVGTNIQLGTNLSFAGNVLNATGGSGGISHAVGTNGLSNVNDSTIELGGTITHYTQIDAADQRLAILSNFDSLTYEAGQLIINNSSDTRLRLNAGSGGSVSAIQIQRNEVLQWVAGEAGTGNYVINRYDSTTGAFKESSITINQSTGLINFGKYVSANFYQNDTASYKPLVIGNDGSIYQSSWVGSGGGGSSLFPTSGTGTATGNVIGEMAGNTLTINDAASNSHITFVPSTDPTLASGLDMSLRNATGGGNRFEFNSAAEETQSIFYILGDFNDGAKAYRIDGYADEDESELTYTADTHLFTGNTIFASNGTPDVGKVPTGTDNAGNWTWQTPASGGLTRQVITSGSSGTVTGGNYIVTIDPASTLAAYTLTLPASPSDLEIVEIDFGGTLTNGTIVTALTVSPNSGQTILDNTPPTSATADNTILYRYRASNTTWYRFKP